MEMGKTALSTASFCLWTLTAGQKLEICREFKFSRVEIAIPHIKMLKNYLLTPPLLEQLKGFQEITIHAPWCDVYYGNNLRTTIVLEYLRQLNSKLEVEAFVFHIDRVIDINVLTSSGLPLYLENSEKHGSWPEFRRALKKTNFKCVLNINRATRNEDYLDRIMAEYGDRIAQIQVSGFAENVGRTPLLEAGQVNILEKVKFIKAPFVMEGLFVPGDFTSIAKEKEIIEKMIS